LRHLAENLRAAEQGSIRIAATPAFGIDLLPRAIASYRDLHPETVFLVETLHHDEIASALQESRIDVGLAFDPEFIPGIARMPLARASFVVLAPPDMEFEGKKTVSIRDLDGLDFINLDARGPLGRLLSNHIESSGAELNHVAHAETYQVAKALVSYGVGVTIVDEITALSSGHESTRRWPLEPEIRFGISALHLDKSPLSIVCQQFIGHFKDSLGRFLSG
jgi:DNA-binding transcriptional LysR family regulator